ncbi:uncharacterized protein SPSK_07667 [Sporothrix schenckii 1099-18]|uniref:Chalcone isomerase domain-containing protein n=2 Tax=Sporothrix schenckii TaxID=29908 RepID=U7PYC1_SPOS1|nr:uncharacterized protein SPSK_07667 [Sporothrix schenckii 1099-18]ERT00598.1 hypothetical protein HMPREF1624_01824 [Sporothrix schenckii ATCC 58251]KJR87653.1 hypothetical protein SPSK_07667 [Sporothrix schenckii 1099-18]
MAHNGPKLLQTLQRRTFLRSRDSGVRGSTYDTLNVPNLARKRHDYDRTRLIFLATGSVAGLIAMGYTGWQVKKVLEKNPKKLDATGTPQSELAARKVVVHNKDGREIVPTGNSIVTEFPRTVELPLKLIGEKPQSPPPDAVVVVPQVDDSDGPCTEYTLVGLGTRTVTFLKFEVYVVGFYVATADIAALQNRLIKRVNPIATALVSGEKNELRASLLDPTDSQTLWDVILEEGVPTRSLFRIVPVRDTDFPHLRDGFQRAIKSQAPRILDKEKQEEGASNDTAPDFGESMREFRQIFNRGKAKKGRELMLVRGSDGKLSVIFDDGRSMGRQLLGTVGDERLSRALWLNYLGGANVASEAARQSIANGMIEFVERPIGTVAAQVI